ITVTPAPAAQLEITQPPPAAITAGSGFGLQATIKDAYGNLITSDSSTVTVALATSPTGATLGGTRSVTAHQGVASFSGLTLTQPGSGYTLQVSRGGLAATSGTISVNPAAPAKLVVAAPPPGSLIAGSGFGLSVEVEDAYGNLTAYGGSVAVAVATGPAGAIL